LAENLRIKVFYGTSKNAGCTQILIAVLKVTFTGIARKPKKLKPPKIKRKSPNHDCIGMVLVFTLHALL
jgi:hypothetical protein